MIRTCLICTFKITFIFSSLCYGFLKYNCPHNVKNPSKIPWVSDSPIKRLFCAIFHPTIIILGIVELFLIIKTEHIGDNLTTLSIMELVTLLATIKTLIQANLNWKKKLTETRVMIYVSHYLNKFPIEDPFFEWNYKVSIAWILLSIIVYGSEIIILLVQDDLNLLVYLKCINRLTLGYLLTSFYLKFWMDISCYVIFLRRLFAQITREVDSKIFELELVPIAKELFVVNLQTNFLKKLKTLKRLYLMILESLQRTRLLYAGILDYTVLGNFLLAIWILAVTCITINGRYSLGFNYYTILIMFILKSILITMFAILTDHIQNQIEKLQSVLYKLPSRQLTLEETAEVESFIKLLGWRQPMKTVKDSYKFGISSVSSLTLEVIVNSMVVTQLYIFLDQQLKDE